MKKVGLVTCYFQHNYGSMLQAYATQMILDKLKIDNETINIVGFQSEIRNAKIKYFIKASLTSDILIEKIGMAKNVVIKRFGQSEYVKNSKVRSEAFEGFSRRYIRVSKKYLSKLELEQESKEQYSDVVVGSDQLWLPANIEADYYTLNFVPNKVNSIAYATSFGVSTLPLEQEKKAKIFLNKIKHISVREESGKQLVHSLTGRDVPVVCDPTLLFTGEEWLEIQKQEPMEKEPYILCYFLGNNPPHREFAKRLKQETGCKIIALTHLDEFIRCDEEYADSTPYDIDPADFLNLIRHASYVCTDSFHCSVFAILYKKEFFTFRRYARNTKQSTNSRLDTLFNMTGIVDRVLEGNENIKECINLEIDYEEVHSRLKQVREKSLEYLVKALGERREEKID